MNDLLMRLSGLMSQSQKEDVHGQRSGVFRGDRNRNARLGRLRELVRLENTIVGIDLADKKQTVVCDHDSRVLARRTFGCRVWDLELALDWAAERAAVKGFVGVTVSCEADRIPSAASSEQDMIKRWIHMDTHSRIPGGLTGWSLPQGRGPAPTDPRRPMLP